MPPLTCLVRVDLGKQSYDIAVGSGTLKHPEAISGIRAGDGAMLVSNSTVYDAHGERTEGALRSQFRRIDRVLLPDGEAHKHWSSVSTIIDALVAGRHDRNVTLVALGGGVVGDITGFAAACYMRGVAYIQVPTTLLAQVDSAVGGKTAINHAAGKNLIGAFHQPVRVIADVDTLQTLPLRELLAGLAEVIKYGAIADPVFLGWIEAHLGGLLERDTDALIEVVRRSCEIKAQIVSADEREGGRRAILNFGHTFGHAIETALGYGTWLHGEAVACGMVMAAQLSLRLGMIEAGRASRLEQLIARAGLPTRAPAIDPDAFIELMAGDKKAVRGQQRFVLLSGAEEALVAAAPEAEVRAAIAACTSGQ